MNGEALRTSDVAAVAVSHAPQQRRYVPIRDGAPHGMHELGCLLTVEREADVRRARGYSRSSQGMEHSVTAQAAQAKRNGNSLHHERIP